jgi:CheY-like chemotaxis protein
MTNAHTQPKAHYDIFIVDDNEGAALALATLLKFRGHTTSTAASGAEALSALKTHKPQLLFLDIGLPDMTGFDVAKELRRSGCKAKMIALSGYGQERDKQLAFEAGMNAHLTKPAELAQIEAAIEAVMTT